MFYVFGAWYNDSELGHGGHEFKVGALHYSIYMEQTCKFVNELIIPSRWLRCLVNIEIQMPLFRLIDVDKYMVV